MEGIGERQREISIGCLPGPAMKPATVLDKNLTCHPPVKGPSLTTKQPARAQRRLSI